MAKLVAQEVMTEYNSRSCLGRVVVNPPKRMSPLELHDTLPMYLCCGRAFLSEESYTKHKAEIRTHGKPIDLTNIRTAINDRSSIAFWRSRKKDPAMRNVEEDEDEGLDHQIKVEGSDWNEDFQTMSKEQRKQPAYRVVGKGQRYKTCTLCKLQMPGTNIPRHIRTCHNPANQFTCKYCACRFVSAYGRMIHELKSHKQKPVNSAVRSTKKLISLAVNQKKRAWKSSAISVGSETKVLDSEEIGYVKIGPGCFQCNFCEKTFQSSGNARNHANSHTGARPHGCPQCSLTFSLKGSVRRHIKTCHVPGGCFECPYNCGCVMATHISRQMHAKLCKNRQSQEQPLRTKVIQYPKPKRQFTKIDSETIKIMKSNQVGPNLYHCDICNKDITCSGNFRDHLNIHTGAKPHKCPLCYLTFTFKSNIKRHIRGSHVKDGAFICPNDCGCMFANEHGVKVHLISCQKQIRINELINNTKKASLMKMIPKLQTLTSTFVSNGLTTASNVKGKGGRRFSAKNRGPFKCEVCAKLVISKRNLRNHMLIHLDLKPFKCDLCGFNFRAIESLKKHQIRSHVPSGVFRCADCPCRFNREQGLMMHKTMYHRKQVQNPNVVFPTMPKLKPMPRSKIINSEVSLKNPMTVQPIKTETGFYECSVCGKVLQSLLSLRNHGFIHSGEKPVQCKICGHRFRLASTLHDHMKSSHSNGSFMCKQCPCRFESENGLYRHEGVFHGIRSVKYAQRKANHIKKLALKSSLAKRNSSVTFRSKSSNFSQRASPIKNIQNSVIKSRRNIDTQPFRQASFKMEVEDNDSSSLFQCGHCGVSLNTLQALSDHQKIHTQPDTTQGPTQCPVCSHKLHGVSHYRLHMKSNHSGGEYQCIHCPSDFDSQNSLSRHLTRYHSNGAGARTRSPVCPVVIKVESTDSEFGIEIYDDNDENGEIEIIENLPPEVQTVPRSSRKETEIPCEICGKIIKRGKQDYKDHMNLHLNIRPYECQICLQKFRTYSILFSHKKKSHGNGRHHCKQCPCRFATAKGLSVHRFVYHKGGRIEKGDKEKGTVIEQPRENEPVNLDVDDFSQDAELNANYCTPVKIAPIIRSKGSPKDRPMKCKECGEICLGPIRLQAHIDLHAENTDMSDMPTECCGCGVFFETNAAFQYHIKINAGDPFRCAYCCLTVTTEEALQEHFDDYHSQEEPEIPEALVTHMDLDFPVMT